MSKTSEYMSINDFCTRERRNIIIILTAVTHTVCLSKNVIRHTIEFDSVWLNRTNGQRGRKGGVQQKKRKKDPTANRTKERRKGNFTQRKKESDML